MKRISGIIIILIMFVFIGNVFAQITAEDLLKDPNISSTTRDAIAKALNDKTKNLMLSPQNADKWMNMGDAFSTTIKQVCNTLNVEVNAFLQSDVGRLTAAVIIYKMVGHDLLRIGLYSIALFMMTFICLLVSNYCFVRKKVKDKQTGDITLEARVKWDDDFSRSLTMFIVGAVWVIFTAILLVNII